MEYIDGQNLKDIIKNEGTLDEYTALDITKQIAMALSAAHKKGIVHRDIKPHNILISNEGRIVKVADFGIAKAASNSTMTNIGSIIGSVHYFSPEQAKGNSVNATADLYSLGIVLYEMIIGRVPFRGDSPISIALQHINEDVEFTSEEKINIPQSVRTIIKKLTEKSSENRYQSAEELIEDIDYVEKNIDLDFIKEYDNFATKKIDVDKNLDLKEDDKEILEEAPKIVSKPKKEKSKKKNKKPIKEDSPKVRKRLKIIAVILSIILLAQGIFIFKFVSGLLGGNSTQEQVTILPDFKGKDLEYVNKELERLGLKILVKSEYSDTVEKDYVISQSPAAGMEVSEGDSISIVLSSGPKQNQVPNIVGLSLIDAERVLEQNNLKLGNVRYEYSDSYKKDVVITQTPSSGSGYVSEGNKVDVIVSKGPMEIQEEKPNNEITDTPNSNINNSNNTQNKPSKPNKPINPDDGSSGDTGDESLGNPDDGSSGDTGDGNSGNPVIGDEDGGSLLPPTE